MEHCTPDASATLFRGNAWTSYTTPSGIHQGTKLLVLFAVVNFVYVLSEPCRPKRLSSVIFCCGAVLALALPAPGTGVRD